MQTDRRLYAGPALRRLRRDIGVTQAQMAEDLEISPSYVALLERNHRPLSAELVVRLAQVYRFDVSSLTADGGADQTEKLTAALKDPLFSDIGVSPLEAADLAANFPTLSEAFLRLFRTYRENQMALADRTAVGGVEAEDPVEEVRRFLAARRNYFPALDEASERLAARVAETPSWEAWLTATHGFAVRRVPERFMAGSVRRLDHHRRELLLDDGLSAPSRQFHLAQQAVYLEMAGHIDAALGEGEFAGESGRRLGRRALAAYAAGAAVMPYTAFARAAESRRYDVEALAAQFGVGFEQAAHRLTTLQKPGYERVPFFFLRVDAAGNVSKRLDGAGFPFARHGGGCPLWSVHTAFRRPGEIVMQWLELPDGQKFFSIARTVVGGARGFNAQRTERVVALGCAEAHAQHLIYAEAAPPPERATPIGITCRLCQRPDCAARAAPPLGRQILSDEVRRLVTPFGFSDA
jgi:XRE family transcriptional regulator, fatty acid utilization regulator